MPTAPNGVAPIPDEATWRALAVPAGCSRMAWALLTCEDQRIPDALMPVVVDLAWEHSPELMWALLTTRTRHELPGRFFGPQLRATIGDFAGDRRDGDMPIEGWLLLNHRDRLDPAAVAAVVAAQDAPGLLELVDAGALSAADAGAFAAGLHANPRTATALVRQLLREGRHAAWADTDLLDLLAEAPATLAVLAEAGAVAHGDALTARLRTRLQHLLGDNVPAWRAFAALVDNPPPAATTTALTQAALAVAAAPARPVPAAG